MVGRGLSRGGRRVGARIAALGAFVVAYGLALPAWAGQYEALCGGAKCSIIVSPSQISSPYGVIPARRVTYWGSTGDSKTSVGTGVATTILFGGIGLLGFLAKNHQYSFTVNGFDATGRQVSMQFEFKNDKPVKSLVQEMVLVTGLGMGQTRTVEEIKAAESGVQEGPGAMPVQVNPLSTDAPGLGGVGSGKGQSAKNCWSTYLDKNPAMKTWADSNPAQAEQNKRRFDDC